MRTIGTFSDKLLGLLVPRVTARAEPCGPLVTRFCYCRYISGVPYQYVKQCCKYSGSCYPCKLGPAGC